MVGLKLGADDYLVKPFDIGAPRRVEALLRRGRPVGGGREGTYAFGDVRVDFRRAEVVRAGRTIALSGMDSSCSPTSSSTASAAQPQRAARQGLGVRRLPQSRTVDVHVGALRQKLERVPAHPELIVTVHRQGYRFTG